MRQSALAILSMLVLIFMPLSIVYAQQATANAEHVQELTGSIEAGQVDVYRLSGLKQGQVLYVLIENTSGNLDPLLFVEPAGEDLAAKLAAYQKAVNDLIANSPNPLLDIPKLRDQYTLAWDDDSGPGYNAALHVTIPQDGDYFLVASSSLSSAGRQTSGQYRLLLGLDDPQVLTGKAQPNGAVIAVQDQSVLPSQLIQEYTGTLNKDKPSLTLRLNDINPGDTLYVNLQSTSGDLEPVLFLRDYGKKPVRVANLNGGLSNASLQQPFPEGGSNYTLNIGAAAREGQLTSGDFKLLVGLNAPEVLQGEGQPNTESLIKLPIPVQVGLKLQQIINIDQPNEIMNDAGTIKLEWTDPRLAYDPSQCDCSIKEYNENNIAKFIDENKDSWPDFTFFNQQGNRWIQNRLLQIEPNGHAVYWERFSTDFQLDFDWTAYPFDRQDFYIKVDMLHPEEDYVFVPMENFSQIDPSNGEDEFMLTTFDTKVTSEVSSRLVPTSRFTFHFSAPRHIEYYVFRILIPILLIITVSYITFFLKDYSRRIEIATGNLLLFIAFSFSLGENYPRMGYLTFLDAIMAITFIINTIVVALNVYFKWLEQKGEREKADRLEAPWNYIYPIAYVVSFGIAALIFLR